MEFNTVDGFQGREVDILVLSTVRAAESCSVATKISSSNIGFVADVRRMNVALTRARLSLWILGNARTLQTNHNWAALVRDAKERNLLMSVKKPYGSMFKSALKKLPVLENPDNYSKELKQCKNTKESSSHSGAKQKNADDRHEVRHIRSGARSDRGRAREEKDFSVAKGSTKTYKRARDKCDVSINKDPPSAVVESSEGSTSKYMQSAITGKGGTDDQSRERGSSERQLDMRNANLRKGKGRFEKPTCNVDQSDKPMADRYKLFKPIASEGPIESFEVNRTQTKMEVAGPYPEGIVLQGDRNDGRRAMNQFNPPKDAITKRKQQRDAVDALLSSALISSKKIQTSLKSLPPKRPVSPKSLAGRGRKLPKLTKVSSSSSVMEDQSHQFHSKREKSLSSREIR
ncbi:hypothetical protein U1Q18_006225 [Sarracenia purpurea var. burkii]